MRAILTESLGHETLFNTVVYGNNETYITINNLKIVKLESTEIVKKSFIYIFWFIGHKKMLESLNIPSTNANGHNVYVKAIMGIFCDSIATFHQLTHTHKILSSIVIKYCVTSNSCKNESLFCSVWPKFTFSKRAKTHTKIRNKLGCAWNYRQNNTQQQNCFADNGH